MKGAALTCLGVGIVAAHALGFVVIARHSAGTDLAIEIHAPLASATPTLDGIVPEAIAARTTQRDDPPRGLYRRRWSVRYRGGFTREVGATQLVGPFQDPAAPPCSGRIVVGQRLLDDGHAGAGTIAGAMAAMIASELRGESVFPVGDFQRISQVALRWARVESHPGDRELVGDSAPNGYVRVAATAVFQRVEVPIVVALIPERSGTSLHFRIAVHVELAFGNRLFQWVSDKLGGDKLASRLARRQIDDVLITTFAPPPPFDLGGGQRLQFVYCDGPVEISEGAYGALPFAVAIGRLASAPEILPPRFGIGARPPPPAGTALALDLDPDALDALLYELWRTGWLDRQLADVGLDRRFNSDPIVTEFLSIRISPLRLALPPVIEAASDGTLRLSADARVAIEEGAGEGAYNAPGTTTTTGRVFGALQFSLAPPSTRAALPISVDLGALELSCERSATTLVPCYADLVTALRDRGSDFHGALTRAFADLIAKIFIERRLDATGLPLDLVIRNAVPTLAGHGTLHLDIDAALVPPGVPQ